MKIKAGTLGRIVNVDNDRRAALFDGTRARVLQRLYFPDGVLIELLDDSSGAKRGTTGELPLRYFVADPKPAAKVKPRARQLDREIAAVIEGRRGTLSGIGRIAGRKIAYVRWADGTASEYALSAFRRTFGVSALSLATGAAVTENV